MIDHEFSSDAERQRFINEVVENGIEESELANAVAAFERALSHVLMYEMWRRSFPGVTLMWDEEEQDFALKGIRIKK